MQLHPYGRGNSAISDDAVEKNRPQKNKAPPKKSTGKKTNYKKNSDDVLAKLRCAKAIEKKLRRGPDDPTMLRCALMLSKSNQQTTKNKKNKKKQSPNG